MKIENPLCTVLKFRSLWILLALLPLHVFSEGPGTDDSSSVMVITPVAQEEIEHLNEDEGAVVVIPSGGMTPLSFDWSAYHAQFAEPAVPKALSWLKEHQRKDGSWNALGTPEGEGNVACTGLALLAFLANGDTPSSSDSGPTVAKGLRFLVEHQDKKGFFRPRGAYSANGQAIATYALAAAYEVTDNILLREPLERGVNVMKIQLTDPGVFDVEAEGENAENLLTGIWQVLALESASLTLRADLEVEKLLQLAVDELLLRSALSPNGDTNKTLRAVQALALHLSGRAESEAARESITFLEKVTQPDTLPSRENLKIKAEPREEILFGYVAVHAFFQQNPEGENFSRFKSAWVEILEETQADDGHWDGFAENGKRLGSVVNTALGAMTLMVYYPYLR